MVVNLRRHFPLKFPRPAYATIVVALAAFLTAQFMSPLDLFGHEEKQRKLTERQAQVDQAKRTIENALATVNAVPKAIADNEAIKLAKAELTNLQNQPVKDPQATNRSAYKALQDMNAALKEQLNSSQEFAQAQNDSKMLKSMPQPAAGEGPVADAHRALAQGDFDSAVTQLEQAVDKFDKMDEEGTGKGRRADEADGPGSCSRWPKSAGAAGHSKADAADWAESAAGATGAAAHAAGRARRQAGPAAAPADGPADACSR